MNLYHLQFDTDQEARDAFVATNGAIQGAGGQSWVAPADGAGPAYHVIVLPDTVTAESLGIEGAAVKTSFEEDVEADDGELDAALDGPAGDEEPVEETGYFEVTPDGE